MKAKRPKTVKDEYELNEVVEARPSIYWHQKAWLSALNPLVKIQGMQKRREPFCVWVGCPVLVGKVVESRQKGLANK